MLWGISSKAENSDGSTVEYGRVLWRSVVEYSGEVWWSVVGCCGEVWWSEQPGLMCCSDRRDQEMGGRKARQ